MTGAAIACIQRLNAWSKKHPRYTAALVLVGLLLGLGWHLTRPGAMLGRKDGTWHRIQTNKDLYVGIDPSYPPFAQWTPDGIVGIEADLAREISERFGVETQLLIMGYDGLYDALYTGTVDMIIAGLLVDPNLTSWVHYSQAYFDAGQVLVSPASAPVDHIRELDGKTIAVEMASSGDLAAQRWARRLRALTIRRFMLPQEAIAAVQRHEVAAALVDTISARLYLSAHSGLVMAERTTVAENYVIAMRKGDFRLVREVESALDAIRSDGTMNAIIARWLPG